MATQYEARRARLKTILPAYPLRTEDWLHSKSCPLNPRELRILNSFREHKTLEHFIKESGELRRNVLAAFQNICAKLESPKTICMYHRWLVYMDLLEAGFVFTDGGLSRGLKSIHNPISTVVMKANTFVKLNKALYSTKAVLLTKSDLEDIRRHDNMTIPEAKYYAENGLLINVMLMSDAFPNDEAIIQ